MASTGLPGPADPTTGDTMNDPPWPPEHNHAWGGPRMSDWCKPGCPFFDAMNDALDVVNPGRVTPRECFRAARDALNNAYSHGGTRECWPFIMEALDWQRRGLEQIAALLPAVPVAAGGGDTTAACPDCTDQTPHERGSDECAAWGGSGG